MQLAGLCKHQHTLYHQTLDVRTARLSVDFIYGIALFCQYSILKALRSAYPVDGTEAFSDIDLHLLRNKYQAIVRQRTRQPEAGYAST